MGPRSFWGRATISAGLGLISAAFPTLDYQPLLRRNVKALLGIRFDRRYRMSTLDEITKEKQRISDALARIDAQREKLSGELSDLEATERVLRRYASAERATTRTNTTAQRPSRGGPRISATQPGVAKRSSPSLSDQVLVLATGKTQQQIAAACKGARANHVGAAIAGHKRAGRIEERDGKLYATKSAEMG
jgi:hypothetical protein